MEKHRAISQSLDHYNNRSKQINRTNKKTDDKAGLVVILVIIYFIAMGVLVMFM